MFGYITPCKPELKIKDFEIFRGYYCAVCKSIAKEHGQIPRLALSYESTFLSILLSSIFTRDLELKKENCILHPIKKRITVKSDFNIISYSSDMNLLLAYYKTDDDIKDDTSIIALGARLALNKVYNKLIKRYNKKCDIIESKLKELRKIEKEECTSMDKAAEPFAKLMEEVFAYPSLKNNDESVLRWIGYNTGKWIYLVDALDDLKKDINKKNYNPLIYQFNYESEEIEEFKKRIKKNMEFSMLYCLNQISSSYELLNRKKNTSILDNIIYIGMQTKTDTILNAGSCKRIEKSI